MHLKKKQALLAVPSFFGLSWLLFQLFLINPLQCSSHLCSSPLAHPPSSSPTGCACCHIQGYVGDPWNVFDALVVIGSVVDIILSQVERHRVCTTLTFPRPALSPLLLHSFISFLPVQLLCFCFAFFLVCLFNPLLVRMTFLISTIHVVHRWTRFETKRCHLMFAC